MNCPRCGASVPAGRVDCPACGSPLVSDRKPAGRSGARTLDLTTQNRRTIYAVAVLAIIGWIWWPPGGDSGPEDNAETVARAAEPDPAAEQRFQACAATIEEAQGLNVLYALDCRESLNGCDVTVGPAFFTLPIDAKEAFSKTMNCFLTHGQTDRCANMYFEHWQTGKRVAKTTFCRFTMD